jgi:histidinol-phosphate phosphatase family protein
MIMHGHNMNSFLTQVNSTWTLFLDRDGVINKKIDNDYVHTWKEFEFLPGAVEALKMLSSKFRKIIIVTNQQGIGKKLMSEADLQTIHHNMICEIEKAGGRIDKIYFAPHLKSENSEFRKPAIGMALQAKKDFSEIDLSKSIMAGDSLHDMEFGKKAGMKTIFISLQNMQSPLIDLHADSLKSFAGLLN